MNPTPGLPWWATLPASSSPPSGSGEALLSTDVGIGLAVAILAVFVGLTVILFRGK